jgi:hypothetical protein
MEDLLSRQSFFALEKEVAGLNGWSKSSHSHCRRGWLWSGCLNMFSNLGINYALVEAHPGTSILPKAHILNQRTAEIVDQYELWERSHRSALREEMPGISNL